MVKRCFMLDCEGEAKYFIRDAEQDPKEYNGKKICAECFEARKLLKAEPKSDDDD